MLPAIPGDVVVDAPLQRFQQGGLAMIAPAGDQGDPPADAHTPDKSQMGQFQCHRQIVWGHEGHCVLHGPV